MGFCVWLWMNSVWLLPQARAGECGAFEGIEENLPLWVSHEQTFHLTASNLDPSLDYSLDIKARLASLSTSFSQNVTVDESGDIDVAIDVPPGAFLHALAEDYVTDLSIKLVGRKSGVVQLVLRVPSAFLAWPSGPLAPPVLWDAAAMQQNAPLGVVDATLRETFTDAGVDRVLAPIPFSLTPQER